MSLLTDDGKIKSIWLLDHLGRPRIRNIVPSSFPGIPIMTIPLPIQTSAASVQPSGSSTGHNPDPVPASAVGKSGESDDLFDDAEIGFGCEDDGWFGFISEIDRNGD
jgi:hypothetical protein